MKQARQRASRRSDAVRFILRQAKLDPEPTAIVGDRQHHVIAGMRNGIFTIGVSYECGSRRELHGADRICDTPHELLELFRK